MAIRPSSQPLADTAHERIVNGLMTDGATKSDRFQAAILIESSFHSQYRTELNQCECCCRIVEIYLPGFHLLNQVWRQGVHVNFESHRQRRFGTNTRTGATYL